MIARVLDIPDDPADMAAWLDMQIAGADLHEVVAELAAVHGVAAGRRPADADEVSRWLGPALPDVLTRGTGGLDRQRMGELLRVPRLLPGLQELVFVEGGDYWRELAERALPGGLPALDAGRLVSRASPPAAAGDAKSGPQAIDRRREAEIGPGPAPVAPGHGRRSHGAAILAALAACLLIGVGVWSWRSAEPPAAPWGWNRADALAAAAPDNYLDRLAAGAVEWSAVRPATAAALAGRLREMLAGCDRLITAPHEPLAAADREWLVEKCRAWREKLAGHLAALAESHDVAAVQRDADATVEKLTAALRARAGEVRQRRGEA